MNEFLRQRLINIGIPKRHLNVTAQNIKLNKKYLELITQSLFKLNKKESEKEIDGILIKGGNNTGKELAAVFCTRFFFGQGMIVRMIDVSKLIVNLFNDEEFYKDEFNEDFDNTEAIVFYNILGVLFDDSTYRRAVAILKNFILMSVYDDAVKTVLVTNITRIQDKFGDAIDFNNFGEIILKEKIK